MKRVDATKLTASARIAYGAVTVAISAPDTLGPATCETLTVSWSFELPSTRCSRSISAGRYDWYATSKNTVKIPITNCRTRRCHIRSSWRAHRIGTSARRSARAASPTMRIWRRRSRSTQTPAGSAKRMNGRKPSTPSSENSNGDASSPTAASHGIASCDTCEPNSLIDWPPQSLRKSRFCQSALVGLRIDGPLVEGGREAVGGGAVRRVGGAEVVDQLLEPATESSSVGVREVRADDGEGRPAVVADGKHFLGCAAEGSRGDVPDVLAVRVGALEQEQARGPPVVLLGYSAHLP